MQVMIEVSARHVHLSRDAIDALFGAGYQLTFVKPLSQPGQFVAKERVALIGGRNTIQNVVILGPERPETQIEVSITDTVALGVPAPIRESGDLNDAPEIAIRTERGEAMGKLIIAKRHLHATPADAARLGITDRQIIWIEVDTPRKLVFGDVVARVSEKFSLAAHIDTDEANAAAIGREGYNGKVIL